MSLIEDIKAWYKDENYPPDGPELDQEYVDGKWVSKGTTTEQVSREVLDTSGRWGNSIQVVYRRGDEYIAISDMEPATELQDWGDYGEPEIYAVEPVEITVVKYKKVS